MPRGTHAQHRSLPPGRRRWRSRLGAPGRPEWADFDRVADRVHDLTGPGQRCIEIVRVDDVEPADVLLRLDERPVSHDQIAITHADDGRRVGAMECATEDERTARLHLGFEGSDPLHECPHLLGRRGAPGGLTLPRVGGQPVLTHGYSSVGAVRSSAHPAYEWDRPTRTPTARIVLNDPCPRFLVRDRAGQFTASFDAVLASVGITAVKIPPRSPCPNAYAERFILTARTEITNRMLIFGERHLRAVLAEYEAHYNGRRPHRSRQLHPPRPDHPPSDLFQKRIKRQPVLGGLINEYERAASKAWSKTVAES